MSQKTSKGELSRRACGVSCFCFPPIPFWFGLFYALPSLIHFLITDDRTNSSFSLKKKKFLYKEKKYLRLVLKSGVKIRSVADVDLGLFVGGIFVFS